MLGRERQEMVDIKLTIHANAREFIHAAGKALYASESANNLILGIAERLHSNPHAYDNPFFATIVDSMGALSLAAIMTPPHNIILAGDNPGKKEFQLLISCLKESHIMVPGAIGPVQIIEPFARVWVQNKTEDYAVEMRQRVYELRAVNMPSSPPGCFRAAEPNDLPIVTDWLQKFEEEALGKINQPNSERAKALINGGAIFGWDVEGEIVSMAMKTRPIAHSVSIGSVYTPHKHRRKGYASALVAHLSQHLLDSGCQYINLFTDLDNPTSNKIYMNVGFQPVCDFLQVSFR